MRRQTLNRLGNIAAGMLFGAVMLIPMFLYIWGYGV